jgi:hypothetical protein
VNRIAGIVGVCALSLLWLTEAIAAPAPAQAPAEAEPCSANIEDGKRYHWYTHKGSTNIKSGYIMFTSKRYGRWAKVVHLTDKPKKKLTFWGYHRGAALTIKSTGLGERWTAYKKYCKGTKIMGSVFKGGKKIHSFTVDTSRVREK